ncbi:putative leucine-rich repeat-containing protein DDB_G0290503 [Polyergus mexicanus]|uniref:putative leucine-rich repeat-containing protein DDB_G0290503 n=1 Tax=Polyergus mexicanus TaxID=615972 RepID=UPI0038B58099
MSGIVSLELKIISINVIGLFGSIWNWLKWDQQLEKISKFSVSDEINVKDIDWLKTVLSWIEVVRSVIDRTLFPAYIANIYTIAIRRWQNSLIFWMVLSLLKDIVLEVVVIIITFLQWHKGSVSTLLFIEFITEKIIWLAISTGKWWTIFKWYRQLRREAKIRRFARITRRSIASIPGRIGHSLDDESLDIAAIRRDKYASLLNLNKLAEKSSNKINFVNLRISKSLTSVINNDSHDSNDTNDSSVNDSSVNDLSVTEKSMKLLGITAEDVMDACARIQERFYWNEEDVTEKTPEAKEEVVAQFSLKKDGKEMDVASGNEQKNNIGKTADRTLEKQDVVKDSQIEKNRRKDEKKINDTLRNKQTTKDVKKAVDCNLMKEVIMQNFQIERKGEEDNNKIISIDKKEKILIDEKQDVSLTKDEDVTLDRINNRAKSIESHELQEDASSRKKKERGRAERLASIEHCPLSSAECKNAKNMEAKPCASFVRKLEAKLRPISTNQKERWLDQLDRRKHSYRGKLTPTGSDANKKECHKNSRTSLCACHRASKRNTDASRNGKYARSIDINDKNLKSDIDKKEFRHFLSIVNKQKDKINGRDSTFKYSEAYRLRKQMQKFEGFSTKQTIAWGSMSLAQTARPSGYTRDVAATDPPRICQRDIQTEARDDSSDSLNARNRSEQRIRSGQSIDPRLIYNSSFTEKNYARSEKRETKASEAHNDLTLLENKRGMKARKRHDLSPSRKLSNEEREAVELRALKAFNELTLLEDKKKLEEKKNRESSLNFEQLTEESEVTEMKVYKSYNELTLLEERKVMDATRGYNSNCEQSIEESSALKVCNEYTSEDRGELKTERKHDSSKYEAPERYEENIETSTSVSNHLPKVNREEIGTPSSETRRNANSSSELNERHAGQACMSLNLREITRNIEWTFHPRGIILTNKNLHRQFLENERSRESQQRDIVDDNVASTLHSAFFFKPEIVTRIFRRAQTRIGESLPSFPTFCRGDFNAEFVCRVNNETVVQWDRDSSSFDFDLERITDRGNLGSSSFPDASGNRVSAEDNRDLCIIFIDQEQASHESETAIIEDSTTIGSQEDTRSSVENIETTNILLMCILRDFGIEVSEESVHDVTSSAERIEEYGDISNVIANNADFPSSNVTTIDTSPEEEDRREDTILLHQQILHDNLNDSRPDDVDVASSVNSLHDNLYNLPDKMYISAIDVSSEKIIYENNSSLRDADAASQLSNSSNNNQFDTLINKSEKNICNRIPENASQLSSSFTKEDNQSTLRSSDEEELQRLTQLSDSEVTLENHRRESVMNLETTNNDTISRSENVETSNLLETMVRGVKNENEDEDIYEKANIFSIQRFFRVNQEDESLQQDDSFYSMYERNDDDDDMKTSVSLGDGSAMEEFSNNTISETSSNACTRNSAYS